MNRKGLDEMQLHDKNKIGNQTFVMLLYLLLLDVGLAGFGFSWVKYPANIVIILTISAGSYVVRLILGNAYVGPSTENERPVLRVVLTAIVAVVVAATIIFLVRTTGISSDIDEMTAPILFITSSVAVVVAVISSIIKKRQNSDDSE